MKWKKWLPGFMAAILVLVTVTGCSSSNNDTGSNNSTSANEENEGNSSSGKQGEVVLRFSWWGGDDRHQATLEAIKAYKEVAPHVTIEAEYQGFDGYEQKIKTQLASNTAPDIIQLDYPWMTELSKGNFFLDLSNHPEMNLDTFDEEFLKSYGVFDGKLIALPSGVNAFTLIVNKTAADKLGVPTNIKWDWETLLEEGRKLHEKDNSKYLIIIDHTTIMTDVKRILQQRTGKSWVQDDYTIGFAREDAVAAFTWVKDAFEAGVYQPLGEADLFFGRMEQNPKWINGEIPFASAMTSTLNSMKSVLSEGTEVTTAVPPYPENAKDTAVTVRPSQVFSINANSKHPDEAVKFLNWFLNSKEAAAILGDVRSVPASMTAQQAAVDAGKIDPVIIDAVEQGLANAGSPESQLSSHSELTVVLQDTVEQVAFGKMTPEEAADYFISTLEGLMKELKQE